MEELKRFRGQSEEFDLPEVKRLREDLLQSLDEDDDDVELGATCQDLDSFMKSFEEEIRASPAAEVKSDSDESRPEIGFLLEASDDELGVPPTTEGESELGRVESDSFSELQMFGFGFGDVDDFNGGDGGVLAVEGF